MSKFFLPENYKENVPITHDSVTAETYWTKKRIRTSRLFQWHVYEWASKIAIKNRNGLSIADFGCGSGVKLMEMVAPFSAKTYGYDQESAVNFCRGYHKNGEFIGIDLDRPDLGKIKSAELSICCDVIEHLASPLPLLDAIRKSLANGGMLLISTPDRGAFHGNGADRPLNPYHVREWSSSEFDKLLRSAGYEIIETKHLPPLKIGISPIHLIHRVRQAFPGRSYNYNYAALCKISS